MSCEILLNLSLMETRAAVLENGMLQELYVERSYKRGTVGNIYQGKVSRVLPGMQAAFVDIGLERTAFLHRHEIYSEGDKPINQLVQEGQKLIVQVIKDPIGDKGARLTTFLTLSSRYLVYMPHGHEVKISQKIEDVTQRNQLLTWVKNSLDAKAHALKENESGGFIVRTAAENSTSKAIDFDVNYLLRVWYQIKKYWFAGATTLIYQDLSLPLRLLRDLASSDVSSIKIDSRDGYYKIRNFAQELLPDIHHKIEHYQGERPIFDLYGVEDELSKALERKIVLKSGGYLIIDQTEAMTTIDVNTGTFVGSYTLEETVFKTNLEAAAASARQLRLRNLGGIIIIDFIDMQTAEHQTQVMQTLEKHLNRDSAKTSILAMSAIGTVQITRKRQRESLEQTLCEPCACCGGKGKLRTLETVCYEIFREITRITKAYDAKKLCVLANVKVIERLLDEEANNIAELEIFLNASIRLQAQNDYMQEQYDVVIE